MSNGPFDGNWVQLARAMAAARRQILERLLDADWSQDDLATLDDVRHVALALAREVEVLFEVIEEREA